MLRTVVKEHGVPKDLVVKKPWISYTFVDRLAYLHNWKKNVFKWEGTPEYTALINIRKLLVIKGVGSGSNTGVYEPEAVLKLKTSTMQKTSDGDLSHTASGSSTPKKKAKNPLDEVTMSNFIDY